MRKIAMIGNPNCGKTTLFNLLTNSRQHVGNWPGVTVAYKEGTLINGHAVLIDLPGIYSASTDTAEERVARDYLLSGDADMVINLVDGRSLERGLYLTLQLLELECPLVVAITMMDEVKAAGGHIDCEGLSLAMGVPVIAVSARNKSNIPNLVMQICHGPLQCGHITYTEPLEQAIQHVCSHSAHQKYLRFYAIRMLEQISWGEKTEPYLAQAEALLQKAEPGCDAAERFAAERYGQIERWIKQFVHPMNQRGEKSKKIDQIVLNRYLAYPIFAMILIAVFAVCFAGPGQALKMILEWDLHKLSEWAGHIMAQIGVSPILVNLVQEGIFGGAGLVVTFLPQLMILFFMLTLLEECGYLARAAFIMDKPLRRFGLSGKAFIALLMGVGCTATAVLSTRTLEQETDRKHTVLLLPFISCSAKFPIYILFSTVFFPRRQLLAVLLLYLLGVACAAASAMFRRRKPGQEAVYMLEFPPYRVPSLKNVWRNTWERCVDFLRKAGTLIFLMSVAIWVLQHFDYALRYTPVAEESLFWMLGEWIAPLFKPLGFGFAQAGNALLAGLVSKEAVIASLGVSFGSGGSPEVLAQQLAQWFTPLSAASYLVFCALYMPCISAFFAIVRELGSLRRAVKAMAMQTLIAYLAACAVYQFGTLWANMIR